MAKRKLVSDKEMQLLLDNYKDNTYEDIINILGSNGYHDWCKYRIGKVLKDNGLSKKDYLAVKNEYLDLEDDITSLFIYSPNYSHSILLDTDKVEDIKDYNWRVINSTDKHSYVYTETKVGSPELFNRINLSSVIMNTAITDDIVIVHKNGNNFDLRVNNLWVTTRGEAVKTYEDTVIPTSGVRGIYKNKGKYVVYVGHYGKKYVGRYEKLEDAVTAKEFCERLIDRIVK